MISIRKEEGRMTRKIISVTALLLSTALLYTTNSLAADGYDGTVTLGVGTVSLDNDSSKYGEYNGITEDELFFVGDAEISYNSDGYHMDFTVEDIGHDDRNISIDSGRPGTYRLHLEYDESPHMISNTAKTPFRGAGSDNLTLPTLAQYTTSADIVAAFGLHDVELETKRRSGKIGYTRTLREGLDLSLSFKRENKEGTQSIGGVVMGDSGKWASSAILPEPVDYTTDDLNVALEYSGTSYQASLAYNLSQFDNADDSLTWQNPFTAYNAGGLPTEPYATDGRLALPPDNRSQRLTFNGGATITDTTRISLTAEYGKMEQDEDLLPYATTPTDPLPRESADAEMTSKHLGLNIASRPVRGLAVTAKYRYFETDNDTPFDNYSIVLNDTVGKRIVKTNKPYDYKQNRGNLDISYRVAKSTTLKLGFEHDIMERDERDVEETTEDTYSARVTSRISSAATLGLNYSASDREINDDSALGDMRTFDVADRDRTNYGANMAFNISQDATLGINYNQYSDDYDESVFGLQESDSRSFTLDASFAPTKRAALHAFYTREELEFSLANQYWEAFPPPPTILGNWYADHESVNDTAGLGASFELMGKRLALDINYIYARSTTAIDFTATGVLTGDDMDDLETRRDTLEIDARYKMDKKLSLGLGYQYDKYEEDNWSTDGLDQASIDYILLMSGEQPDYEAHMIKLYATYRL